MLLSRLSENIMNLRRGARLNIPTGLSKSPARGDEARDFEISRGGDDLFFTMLGSADSEA